MVTISKTSKKGKVLSILRKRWVDSLDLEGEIDGDPMRRVRELRADGVNVQKRYNETTQTYQYKVGK